MDAGWYAKFALSLQFREGAYAADRRGRVFFFGAGPLERRSASSSAARSIVIDSGSSPRRRLAFVSPSVTYGPKRPSFTTMGLPLTGSAPTSFSGGFGAPRPRRSLGFDRSSSASSSVTVSSCSSLSSDRESFPFFTYGP